MSIPATLDTFINDHFKIEPTVGLHKQTMQPAIVAKITDLTTGAKEYNVFQKYDDYLDFVANKLS